MEVYNIESLFDYTQQDAYNKDFVNLPTQAIAYLQICFFDITYTYMLIGFRYSFQSSEAKWACKIDCWRSIESFQQSEHTVSARELKVNSDHSDALGLRAQFQPVLTCWKNWFYERSKRNLLYTSLLVLITCLSCAGYCYTNISVSKQLNTSTMYVCTDLYYGTDNNLSQAI
jgi:hypothetical protein